MGQAILAVGSSCTPISTSTKKQVIESQAFDIGLKTARIKPITLSKESLEKVYSPSEIKEDHASKSAPRIPPLSPKKIERPKMPEIDPGAILCRSHTASKSALRYPPESVRRRNISIRTFNNNAQVTVLKRRTNPLSSLDEKPFIHHFLQSHRPVTQDHPKLNEDLNDSQES